MNHGAPQADLPHQYESVVSALRVQTDAAPNLARIWRCWQPDAGGQASDIDVRPGDRPLTANYSTVFVKWFATSAAIRTSAIPIRNAAVASAERGRRALCSVR